MTASGLARRVGTLERTWGEDVEERPLPHIILDGARDMELVHEIARERLRREWPDRPIHVEVTGEDIRAWREGRIDDALRGTRHRDLTP